VTFVSRSFEIRKAVADDGEAVLACLGAAFAPYRSQYTPDAFSDTVMDELSVQQRLREMCVLVAISDASVVGTIGCHARGEEGHLRGMAVLPEWQGSAVASGLLAGAEAELVKAGCKYVSLDTTKPLQRAIRFYERHGFAPSGGVTDFFGMELFEYTKRL
jgi:ribosomal protein S18 acetylase RimI-like enzyme